MEIEQRIAQFRNMAESDPTNDMAHFSLGNALLQNGQSEQAAASFLRCIDLQPNMSKAYQLGGQALLDSGKRNEAVALWTRGFEQAAQRGDIMPRDAMGELLKKAGAPVPKVQTPVAAPSAGASGAAGNGGTFVCLRSGQTGTKMKKAPFRGPLGQHIQETISQETWDMWIRQGTKVINELRLDLSREDHANLYDQHMIEYLGLEDFVSTMNQQQEKKAEE